MTRMFFSSQNCYRATLEGGRTYHADRQGFIHVDHAHDIQALKAGGYVEAGGMPRLTKYWVCDACNWEASINSCARCGSTALRKIER
jgi:hypothetical protein